jgi:signal transduction histidine kinase
MRSSNDIARRAAVGFAMVAAITAAAIVASSLMTLQASSQRERILTRYADDVANAARLKAAAERLVAAGRGYLLTSTPEQGARLQASRGELDAALDALDRDDATATERDLQGFVRHTAKRYEDQLDALIKTTPASEGRQSLAQVLTDRLMPLREDLDGSVEELVAHKRHLQEEARHRAMGLAHRAVWTTVWLGVASMSLSMGLALLFTRRLAAVYRLERESSRRARTALAAKEDLLNIVAHDLRSPLSSIVLRAGMMANTYDDDRIKRPAEAIRGTCERMADLIESLVQAANIEAGNLSISPRPILVADVVAAVIETFGPAAKEASVALEPRVEPRDVEVLADRGRLLQVLSNLVGNALKFTPSGGVVGISATASEKSVAFEVKDTGQGIATTDLPHVFERYWKRDTESSRGAGLGLYIAQGLVEAHGGHITVESPPGEGSSFRFDLPIDAGASTAPVEARRPERRSRLVLGRANEPAKPS